MTKHLLREVERLKRQLLSLSALVEDSVYKAVKAVVERSQDLAKEVVKTDERIDEVEVEIEEDCLKILALHQPVAIDLRFIVAALKMNNDLERIGDLSVNIAWRAHSLAELPRPKLALDFEFMAQKVQQMLRKSLEALVNLDCSLANKVCASDDEIDAINREMHARIRQGIRDYPEDIDALVYLISVSRNLERIADHTTNIAEDVIYMVEGKIVRHKKGQ